MRLISSHNLLLTIHRRSHRVRRSESKREKPKIVKESLKEGKMATLKTRNTRLGIILFLPAFAVIGTVIIYPLIFSGIISISHWYALSKDRSFVGLKNYIKIFSNPQFYRSLSNTLIYTFVGAGSKIFLGLMFALMLNRDFKGRTLARAFLMLPWVIPIVAMCITTRWMYDTMFGVINFVLKNIHLIDEPINFLGSKKWALPSCLAVGILVGYPMAMVMILAGLQSVPSQLYEAAKVDGANTWQCLIHITLPSIRQILTITSILIMITSFNSFDVVWLMSQGGPSGSSHILGSYAFETAFVYLHYDYASAICIVILGILSLLLLFFSYLSKERT